MLDGTADRQLPIPTDVLDDREAAEVLRAWISRGDLHCSLKPTIWADPGHWGILLADVARHVARAMEQHSGAASLDTVARIQLAFNAEMDTPTGGPQGGFQESH